MRKFLVVMSELAGHGRGVNGRTLCQFLRTYAGRGAAGCCRPPRLLRGPPVEAETVFLGLPSSAGERHLARLRCRHLVLFDLTDSPHPFWDDANRDLLRRRAGLYLKTWSDRRWDFGIAMGLAPVRRYRKLWLALQAERLRRLLGRPARPPRFDVLFLGSATGAEPNQRLAWLLEIEARGRHLARWGGLLDRSITPQMVERHGDLSGLAIRGKVPFRRYFEALLRSRVALAPQGNAPWSYRHYEAIYARSLLVTSDLRSIDTLVPLPRDGMVHVEPGAPVLPAIERALALRRERPEVLEENVRFLERWLDRGMYSRRRPELWRRFLAQLPGGAAPAKASP